MHGSLAGVVVACSSFQAGEESSNMRAAVPGRTYDSLRDQAKALGATVSGILHKNVAALVATAEACSQGTQRVRKALRFGVPIVSPAWLDACGTAGHLVLTDSYKQSIAVHARLKAHNVSENKKAGKAKPASNFVPEQCSHNPRSESAPLQHNEGAAAADAWVSNAGVSVDFGCACSCHDADCEPFLGQEARTCEWCESLHAATVSSALQASEETDCNLDIASSKDGSEDMTRESALIKKSFESSAETLAAEALVSNAGVTVDFGCACSCHDADCEPFLGQEAITCEWCESLHAATVSSDMPTSGANSNTDVTSAKVVPNTSIDESASRLRSCESSAETLAAEALVSSAGVTVDFGCACSCHDADCEPFLGHEASMCEWCESLHASTDSSTLPPVTEVDTSDDDKNLTDVQDTAGLLERKAWPQCPNCQSQDISKSPSKTKLQCRCFTYEGQIIRRPEVNEHLDKPGSDLSNVTSSNKRSSEEISDDKAALFGTIGIIKCQKRTPKSSVR